MKEAIDFRHNFLQSHPHLSDEVDDLFQLMIDEIAQGESERNEIDLFISSCEDLLD